MRRRFLRTNKDSCDPLRSTAHFYKTMDMMVVGRGRPINVPINDGASTTDDQRGQEPSLPIFFGQTFPQSAGPAEEDPYYIPGQDDRDPRPGFRFEFDDLDGRFDDLDHAQRFEVFQDQDDLDELEHLDGRSPVASSSDALATVDAESTVLFERFFESSLWRRSRDGSR